MNHYTRQATQADIDALADRIRDQIGALGFTVAPNGYGYRIECTGCGWSKCDAPVSLAEYHAADCTAKPGKPHRYCGGRGFVRLASGADGHCFGCNGTGRIEAVTTEERRARKAADDAFQAAYATFIRLKRADAAPLAGMSMSDYRSAVMRGFEMLAEREPGRLPALYASLTNGRMQAVADALAVYAK